MAQITERRRELYDGDSDHAHRVRYGLLAFDLATLLFIVVSSFLPRQALVETVDVPIGAGVTVDFLSRLAICPRPGREFLRPTTWADLAAIASLLAPIVGEGAGFLRIMRTLRLLRTNQLLDRLRGDFAVFRHDEEAPRLGQATYRHA